MRLLIALVVWAGAVAAAVGLSSTVGTSVGKEQAAASFDAGSVTGADSHSLFYARNFGKALSLARSHLGPGAQADSLVIYPGYLSLTAVTGGHEADVYVNAAGTYNLSQSSAAPDPGSVFPLSHVKGTDTAAIAAQITRASHLPQSQMHYMIARLDTDSHQFQWLVYMTQDSPVEYFQIAGRRHRLSELSANGGGLHPVGG